MGREPVLVIKKESRVDEHEIVSSAADDFLRVVASESTKGIFKNRLGNELVNAWGQANRIFVGELAQGLVQSFHLGN